MVTYCKINLQKSKNILQKFINRSCSLTGFKRFVNNYLGLCGFSGKTSILDSILYAITLTGI
jgi:hypothetical protein